MYYGIKNFRQRAENLSGTEHENRVKTKDVYKMWKRKIIEYKTMKSISNMKTSKIHNLIAQYMYFSACLLYY